MVMHRMIGDHRYESTKCIEAVGAWATRSEILDCDVEPQMAKKTAR